jgi:hypothetical protein
VGVDESSPQSHEFAKGPSVQWRLGTKLDTQRITQCHRRQIRRVVGTECVKRTKGSCTGEVQGALVCQREISKGHVRSLHADRLMSTGTVNSASDFVSTDPFLACSIASQDTPRRLEMMSHVHKYGLRAVVSSTGYLVNI